MGTANYSLGEIAPEGRAIGRAAFSPNLGELLSISLQEERGLVSKKWMVPALHYFGQSWIDKLVTLDNDSSRFGVKRSAPVPVRIQNRHDLLQALHYSAALDQSEAFRPQSVKIEDFTVWPHRGAQVDRSGVFVMRMITGDVPSSAYNSGLLIRGEVAACEAIRRPNMGSREGKYTTDSPQHRLVLAEIYTRSEEEAQAASRPFKDLIGEHVTLGAIGPIPTLEEYQAALAI